MVDEKSRLSLDYQDYSTYLGINWTVGISFFIAILSYILISWQTLIKNPIMLVILLLILMSIEIIFIAVHFLITRKKDFIKNKIINIT